MIVKNKQIGEIVRVPIDSILENPMNYEIYSSKHTKEDEDLENSIQLYGQLEPCIVNKETNQLISGHRRYNTIKRLNIGCLFQLKSIPEFQSKSIPLKLKKKESSQHCGTQM